MGSKIRVLIADDVAETRENIIKLIAFHSEIEVVGQADTGKAAIEQAAILRPDIILMDVNMPDMDGITATERLTLETPETSIIIMSVQGESEYLRRSMLAGAKNYLTKPFAGDELVEAIRQAYARDRKLRSATRTEAGSIPRGKILCVFAGTGGAGKTTVAVNLAVALAKRPNARVAVVDLDLQFGDAALFMNVLPRTTIADFAAELAHSGDTAVAAYMTKFSDAVQLLAAPFRPEQAEGIAGEHVAKLLATLRGMYDFVIVDTPKNFSETTIAALDAADSILLLALLDLPSVKNTRIAMEIMQSLGYAEEKCCLVLNRADVEGGLAVREVEEALRRQFAIAIPNESRLVRESINKGEPFAQKSPDSQVAKQVEALADKLAPPAGAAAQASGKATRRFRFFG